MGKTAHIDDTLDPVWDLEIFPIKIDKDGPNSVEHSTLRVVCFDWDQFGSDDVLGQVELSGLHIMQMAENGDEAIGVDERPMEEADMEKVFEFMQIFQEHDMNEDRLGKMIVGVPQDPSILKHREDGDTSEAAEVVEVASDSPKKKRRKKKRKDGGAGGADGETEGGEVAADQMKSLETGVSGMATTNPRDEPDQDGKQREQSEEAEAGQEGGRLAEPVVVESAGHETCAGEGGHLGGGATVVVENIEAGQQLGLGRQNEAVAVLTEGGDERPDDTKVAHDIVIRATPGAKTIGTEGDPTLLMTAPQRHEILLESNSNQDAEAHRAVPLRIQAPGDAEGNGGQAETAKVDLDVANTDVLDIEADNKPNAQVLSSTNQYDGQIILDSHQNAEDQVGRDINAAKAAPTADVEEGGGQIEKASAESRPEEARKAAVRNSAAFHSAAFHYRDGKRSHSELHQPVLMLTRSPVAFT